jgi:hypothetical protein
MRWCQAGVAQSPSTRSDKRHVSAPLAIVYLPQRRAEELGEKGGQITALWYSSFLLRSTQPVAPGHRRHAGVQAWGPDRADRKAQAY